MNELNGKTIIISTLSEIRQQYDHLLGEGKFILVEVDEKKAEYEPEGEEINPQ